MKKWGLVLLAIVFLAGLTGCDAVQRKFTRKKTVVKQPHFYQLKKYTRKPSPELYKQHFAYWQSWQGELVQFIGDNHKKDERAIEEALGHLKDMQNLLIPSKAEAIEPHIDNMERAREIVLRGELSFANKDYVRSIVEREGRIIGKDFCYQKVKNDIRTNFDDDSAPQLTSPAGKEAPGGQTK